MRYTLTIPNWTPTRLNVLMRVHWAKRRKLLAEDTQVIGWTFRESGIPKAKGRRKVGVRITNPRHIDVDNVLKSTLDALVACSALIDDSPAWCVLGKVTSAKGPRATTITLEDLA